MPLEAAWQDTQALPGARKRQSWQPQILPAGTNVQVPEQVEL